MMPPMPPTHVHMRLYLVDGRSVLWRKADRVHPLSAELATMWVANFKPTLFQALPDGQIVPRGSDPKAVDIERVASEVS